MKISVGVPADRILEGEVYLQAINKFCLRYCL